MAQIILTDSYYTFDASSKTVTLAAPYDELSLGQIVAIVDLETNDVLYNSITQRTDSISIFGAVITHTHGNTGQADTDELQIIINDDVRNRNAASDSTSVGTIVQYVQLIDPDGNPHILHDGHLKVLGLYESIGHLTTNGDNSVERANGNKSAIGGGEFTIIQSDEFIQPPGDTQMYLQSGDAQDNASGTGVQQITITYFNLAWEKKTVQVVPTGVSQVTISVADIYRIHKIVTNKGHAAAGVITITNEAESILYGGINQYKTTMERCIFYVATGEQVTCTEAFAGSVTSGGVEVRLAVSEQDSEGNVVTRQRVPVEVVSGGIFVPMKISETVQNPDGLRIALLLVVRIATVAANQKVTGFMKGFGEPIPAVV